MKIEVEVTPEIVCSILSGFDPPGWLFWHTSALLNQPYVLRPLGKVKVIERVDTSRFDLYADHGERLALVFQVDFVNGETKFYKKDGEYNSYGGSCFEGAFREVKPVTKTVVSYE